MNNQWWNNINILDYEFMTTQSTCKVGTLKPNYLGIYDLFGNTSEWVWGDTNKYSRYDSLNTEKYHIGYSLQDEDLENFNLKAFLSDVNNYWLQSPLERGAGIRMVRKASREIKNKNSIVNDDRVRLRKEPNLQCETINLLNKNQKVVIIAQSTEKQEIENESFFWYKVKINSDTFGWVYGKYLDY